jgi:hypothetical protein
LTRSRADLGRPRLIRLWPTHASGQAAAGAPEPATGGGEVAGVGRKRAPGHEIARGLHLHVAKMTMNLNKGIWGCFGWRPGHPVHGGERRAADKRRRMIRLGIKGKGGGGGGFLTTRRRVGDGLGGGDVATGEIDVDGRRWKTMAAAFG